MLIVALQHSGFDPSFAVGGDLGEDGHQCPSRQRRLFRRRGRRERRVAAGGPRPSVAVVTNIEADHLDFFGSAEAYGAVFDGFVERLKPGGALVVCTRRPVGRRTGRADAAALGIRVLRYGSDATQPLAGALLDGSSRAPALSRTSSCRVKRHSAGDAARGTRQAHGPQLARRRYCGRDRHRCAARRRARRPRRFRGRAAAFRAGGHHQRRAGLRRLPPTIRPRCAPR